MNSKIFVFVCILIWGLALATVMLGAIVLYDKIQSNTPPYIVGIPIPSPVQNVSQQQPSTSYEITSEDIQDWRIYNNGEYIFHYPKNWYIENGILYSPEAFRMRGGGFYSLAISIHSDPEILTTDRFLKSGQTCPRHISHFTLSGRNSAWYTESCGDTISRRILIMEHIGKIIAGESNSYSDETQTLNKVFSTFKFVY